MNDNKNSNKSTFSEEDERIMNERLLEHRQRRENEKRAAEAKKQRLNKAVKRITNIFKVALIVLVALSLLFIAARSFGNVTFSKAADYIRQSISNLRPGEGYPINMGTGSIEDMRSFGDCVSVLRNDGVLLLNSTAKEISSYQHSYSKPIMAISQGRMLIADRTTGRYFVADSGELLHESQLKSEIYCLAINQNGNYAFACAAENASSVLTVYNAKYEDTFSFKCANEYIIGLGFSPNGRYIAAIGLGAENAAVYSKLYVIDTANQIVIGEQSFTGETLSTVYFSENDTIIVLAPDKFYIVGNKSGSIEINDEISFGASNTIASFTPCENGSFALVFTKYGSIDSDVVVLFESNGKQKCAVETKTNIGSITCDGKYLCFVGSDNKLCSYNFSGKLVNETILENNAQKLCISGKYCYALCYGDIVRLNIK